MTPIHPDCGNCGCSECPQCPFGLTVTYDCELDTLILEIPAAIDGQDFDDVDSIVITFTGNNTIGFASPDFWDHTSPLVITFNASFDPFEAIGPIVAIQLLTNAGTLIYCQELSVDIEPC